MADTAATHFEIDGFPGATFTAERNGTTDPFLAEHAVVLTATDAEGTTVWSGSILGPQ